MSKIKLTNDVQLDALSCAVFMNTSNVLATKTGTSISWTTTAPCVAVVSHWQMETGNSIKVDNVIIQSRDIAGGGGNYASLGGFQTLFLQKGAKFTQTGNSSSDKVTFYGLK